MEKKLLALDLDGTTFGEHGVLSPGNRRALEAARGAGAGICPGSLAPRLISLGGAASFKAARTP